MNRTHRREKVFFSSSHVTSDVTMTSSRFNKHVNRVLFVHVKAEIFQDTFPKDDVIVTPKSRDPNRKFIFFLRIPWPKCERV